MNSNVPRISAVICTHNRAGFLRRALESLREQSLPPEVFEVLVIDNASADETEEVTRSMMAQMPNLRYLKEERLGLSWARNTGMQASRTNYIAYLDDDARADRDWLANLLRLFEASNPACIGGRVWLDWEPAAPAW